MREKGKRPSSTPILGIVTLAIFIVGQIVVIAIRSIDGSSSKTSALSIGTNLAIAVLAVFSAGITSLWVWRYLASRRDARVAVLSGGSIVLTAVAGPSLDAAVSLFSAKTVSRGKSVPVSLSVSADARQLTLWSGFGTPKPFLRADWRQVVEVRVDVVREQGRRSRAILVNVRADSELIELPLIIVGRGLFGAFPEQQAQLESIAKQLLEYRDKRNRIAL